MTALDPAQLTQRVAAAARARWPQARVGGLTPLRGGISSLTFATTLTAAPAPPRPVVVKVAPPGLAPVRNRDVLRQARVMRALHATAGVRVPAILLQDAGEPPFFVMELVPGQAYEPKWDVSASPPAPAVVAARARAAARMLAALHAVDPAEALGDEPVLAPADELQRWVRLFATAGDDLRGDEAGLAAALAARVPRTKLPPRVLHGDYRLGNMQCDGPQVAAIIDWEIWSVGDPRHDLAWLMMFTDPVMQRAGRRDAANRAAAAAMPEAGVLLADYLGHAHLAQAPPDLEWFRALAHYKLGATMAVLAKRNRRLAEPDPGLELAARTTPPMLERARQLLG